MSFDARIYIQGSVSYVPHTNRDRLVALFPARTDADTIRDYKGEKICDHYAVVQCRGALLGLPDRWTSIDVSGLWVRVEAQNAPAMMLPPAGGIQLLPALDEVLQPDGLGQYAATNTAALPGQGFDSSLLKAGVYLDVGNFFGDVRFRTECDLRGGNGQILESLGSISNTMVVALGEVDSLALGLRTFDGDDLPPLSFQAPQSPGEEIEVWIRHFCDLEEPDGTGEVVREEEDDRIDKDFVVNYTLLENAEQMIAERDGYKLPVPEVNLNWAGGKNLAGRPNNCAGPENPPGSFVSPWTGV